MRRISWLNSGRGDRAANASNPAVGLGSIGGIHDIHSAARPARSDRRELLRRFTGGNPSNRRRNSALAPRSHLQKLESQSPRPTPELQYTSAQGAFFNPPGDYPGPIQGRFLFAASRTLQSGLWDYLPLNVSYL